MQSSSMSGGQGRRHVSPSNMSHSIGKNTCNDMMRDGRAANPSATDTDVIRADNSSTSANACIAGGEDPIPITMGDDTQLPLPSCLTSNSTTYYTKTMMNYTKSDLLKILVDRESNHDDKVAVVKAIHSSSVYGPKQRQLYRMLPKMNEYYTCNDIRNILRGYTKGSNEWLSKVKSISKTVFGPSEDTIYNMLDYKQKMEDDEVADINNNVSTTINQKEQEEDSQKEGVRVVQIVTPENLPTETSSVSSCPTTSTNATKLYIYKHTLLTAVILYDALFDSDIVNNDHTIVNNIL